MSKISYTFMIELKIVENWLSKLTLKTDELTRKKGKIRETSHKHEKYIQLN